MNKKILSKATALSIAAISVLSTAAMTASADIVYKNDDIAGTHTISGTASLVTFAVSSRTITYTAVLNNSATTDTANATVTYPFVDSMLTTPMTGSLNYSDNQKIEPFSADYDGADSKDNQIYFDKAASANTFVSNLKNGCTYENTYAGATGKVTSTSGKGEKAYAEWKAEWDRYVKNINAYRAYAATVKKYVDAGDTTTNVAVNYVEADGTTTTYYRIADPATNKLPYTKDETAIYTTDKPADDTFVKTVYTATVNTSTVNMATLNTAFGTTVKINQANGVIGTGSDWTINTNSSSSDTTTTTNTWYPTNASYRTPSTISYYGTNGYWYTSAAAANLYAGGYSTTKASNYTSSIKDTELWFSATTGFYYSTAASAKAASENGVEYYQVAVASSVYSTKYGSYKAADGLYYPTVSAAQSASYSYNRTSYYSTKYTTASARYLSKYNGEFYSTASAASSASGTYGYIDLASFTGSTTSNTYYNDPYYYYFMNGGLGWGSNTTKIDPDAPTIYGSSKKSGWDRILAYINTKSTGSTVSIDMNKSTTVPESILSAAKKKGITLNFVNENGSKVKVTSSNIDSSNSINTAVTYNVKNISSSLVNKAKKVNSDVVSTAQIAIGSDSKAAVTVKLSSKRAGCTVKAYRLTAKGSLVLVSTAKVSSTGAVTLSTNQSGTYLLVVMDK